MILANPELRKEAFHLYSLSNRSSYICCSLKDKQSLICFSCQFLGEEKDDQSLACANPAFDWTLQMNMYLIDLLLEQIRARNEISHTFDEQDWAIINALFSEKFGVQFDTYMLENQYTSLMKEYNDINSLLDQNGFAWDETQQKIVADDDIWEAYIKVHLLSNVHL